MALQIAWKRMHDKPTAVYETASTRAFHHGRTETVRSLTSETWAMAEAFDSENVLVRILFFIKPIFPMHSQNSIIPFQ